EMVLRNYNGLEDFNFPKIKISTSVGTGLGALAEEINRVSDKTGVRASFNVQTIGSKPIQEGTTSDTFAINGVIIGKISYKNNDDNGALIAAINSVKDTTGVEAAKDQNGNLVLTSREGRGISITGSIGAGAGIAVNMFENYGRLSLVKNDGRDIAVGGTGFGFDSDKLVAQNSISLRETKGQISQVLAESIGFNSVDRLASIEVGVSALSALAGTGLSHITTLVHSAGSGLSTFVTSRVSMIGQMIDIGPGLGQLSTLSLSTKGFSALLTVLSAVRFSNVYSVSLSAVSTVNGDLKIRNSAAATGGFSVAISALSLQRGVVAKEQMGVKQTAGVTTLKGAMAVMDVAETATTNLDQIRADIGSVQNQLQVTINNITVTQVNVKAAESTIRDVDFASESAAFSKANILAQSGSYAMSQANAVQQNVLRLLQ
ncbi:flagellin, partial [Campylobacter sp. MIT 21-1685]|uniref:flagellin n=1 Tax=unclassified Campylobacter TaxID=2593542 RepID=UPI00224AD739